jgi:hypothetical protein
MSIRFEKIQWKHLLCGINLTNNCSLGEIPVNGSYW